MSDPTLFQLGPAAPPVKEPAPRRPVLVRDRLTGVVIGAPDGDRSFVKLAGGNSGWFPTIEITDLETA